RRLLAQIDFDAGLAGEFDQDVLVAHDVLAGQAIGRGDVAHLAGFSITRCRYADSLGAAAALAYRILRRDGRLDPAAVRFYDRVLFPISQVGDLVLHPVLGKNVWALAIAE
ncbi:MAG: hypothetical protein HQL41_16600, partial [Alphaproteobacteria bacterium]|nr:hypothetical protein [Alphaproteobacteria bacterium]